MTGMTKIAAARTVVGLVVLVFVLAALLATRPTTTLSASTGAVGSAGTISPDDTPWG